MSQQLNSKNTGTVVLLFKTNLVPRRSLLPRCLGEVWKERARERVLSKYLSVTSQLTVESRIDRAENA